MIVAGEAFEQLAGLLTETAAMINSLPDLNLTFLTIHLRSSAPMFADLQFGCRIKNMQLCES